MGIVQLTCLKTTHRISTLLETTKDEIFATTIPVGLSKHLQLIHIVEVSVLGHYLHNSFKAIKDVACIIQQDLPFPKANVRSLLDEMARASISTSQRIFYGRNCKEWSINPGSV